MIPLVVLALQGAAEYRVVMEGGVEGTARVTVARRPEGGKTVRSVIDLKRGGRTLQVRVEAKFDASGSPVRQSQGYGPPGRAPEHETIVTFDKEGANAVVRDHGVPKATRVPLLSKVGRANAAETWFFGVVPKPGDVAKAYTFDPDALEWTLTVTTYVGPVKGGRLLRTVRRDRTSETVMDDAGVPVRIEQGGIRLDRRAENGVSVP